MFTILSFLLAISLLVFVHELGHYLAARWVGVKVLEFSIGFPPKAWGKKIGDTEYIVSWIPMGGYVRLLGQDTEDENPDEPGNYASTPKWGRFLILVAGPLMNLLFAWIFFVLLFMTGFSEPAYLDDPPYLSGTIAGSAAERLGLLSGDLILEVNEQPVSSWKQAYEFLSQAKTEPTKILIRRQQTNLWAQFEPEEISKGRLGLEPWIRPIAGDVNPGSPAEKGGIKPGDLILLVDQDPVHHWREITPLINQRNGKPFSLTFEREGKVEQTQIVPKYNEAQAYWYMGLSQASFHQSHGLVVSLGLGWERSILLTSKTFSFLGQLFAGRASKESLGGPIMIAQMIGAAAKNSLSDLLALMGFISLQLGIFNLFPFPALDGGHVLFLGAETLKGGPLPKTFREIVQRVGFSALLLLILYISVQDGIKLFSGG